MKRFLSLAMCLLLLVSFASAVLAKDGARRDYSDVHYAQDGPAGVVLTSASSSVNSFKAGAGTDTFCLYGGPGSLLGKFQDVNGVIPQTQGWTHRDVTDTNPKWQLYTDAFRGPNASRHYWAGQDAAQQPGWSDAPGYGNSWNELLQYAKTVSNTGAGQVVSLSFSFNHDSEPGYDYFGVEYDSANVTISVLSLDGDSKDASGNFVPKNFPADVSVAHAIEYQGGDYAGDGSNQIVIRLTATSDGAWSDEDGLWPTDGLAMVDDITVISSEGTDTDDFNASSGNWAPVKAPFAGDFSKVFARSSDLDPCREDITPLIGFIDDGTPASNPGGVLPNGDPIPSIGTSSVNWNYGITGGWVVNYNGGVSFGSLNLDNEWWSPEIVWDLAGTADDGSDVAGAFIRFSVYRHLPLFNGQFYQWSVRGRDANTGFWSTWDNRNFVYYSSIPDWLNVQQGVSDLLPVEKDRVQMHLAIRDLATVFAFPGTDATPSPLYDNASFQKYRVAGPTFATRTIDIMGDSFANSGQADVTTQAGRDALDCRIDMNRSVSSGAGNIMGDSMIVDVQSVIPGVAITDPATQITMVYSLSMNPVFEAAIRGAAPVTSAGTGRFGWDQSEGTVGAQQSTTSAGAPIANRWFFDAPDADFMYPGDVFEYYIQAVDDDGRTTTLPADISGFGDGSGTYNRTWTVRGLPTYSDQAGNHPEFLFWNDFGHRGAEAEDLMAFAQNGMQEGVHFDTYTTKGPSSLVDNGLGAAGAHGATNAQIAGYGWIMYESGDLSGGLMSDGSDAAGAGGNTNDKGNDVGLLTTWFNEAADRSIIHFGDNIASYLAAGNPAHVTYLTTVMGVTVNDNNVRDEIGFQTAPHVISTGAVAGMTEDFVAYGGCLGINLFDSIAPGVGAVSAYGYEVLGAPGTTYGPSACVVWDRNVQVGEVAYRKVSMTFPYGFHYIQSVPKFGGRGFMFSQVLAAAGGPPAGQATDATPAANFKLHPNYPNPFNPKTNLSFTLGRKGEGTVRIYNVRGELVRTLAIGTFDAGLNTLEWKDRKSVV